MATQQEVIKGFMASLDATTLKSTAALDEAIKKASGNKFSTIQEAIAAMKKDIAAAGNADKFLKDYCGIILDNDDTGAITGSDAGGAKVKTAESIVPESGALDTSFEYSSFYLEEYGIWFYLIKINSDGTVNQNIISGIEFPNLRFDSLTPNQQYIRRALKTWRAPEALKLIKESYGSNFGFSSDTLINPKRIYFGFSRQHE